MPPKPSGAGGARSAAPYAPCTLAAIRAMPLPLCALQVSGPSVLRAHSVAILKYNASHPRTDVHVDDGVLAMTLALSPRANCSGGGTCHTITP